MRLYGSTTSPYVRKVLLALHETGLRDRVDFVTASGTPLDSGTAPLALNPLGKVPVLERPDGPALHDSRVICRYLAGLSDARLYPAPPALWEVLVLEAMADGILDAALGMVYETRLRDAARRSPDIVGGLWAKIDRALDAIEQRWMANLSGKPDMATLAVAAALGYLDFRLDDRGWRAGRPLLAGWFDRFAERPSMQATAPGA